MELIISSGYQILIIVAFAVIGFGLKYIDDAFDDDETVLSKKLAMLIAPIIVTIAVILAIKDEVAQTILFAILLSVLISGKVDNLIFKLSSIVFVLLLFIPYFRLYGSINFLWLPLVIITTTGVIDEAGNDYVDKNNANSIRNFFFKHRFAMKMGMVTLCGFQFLAWIYLIAFLAFDIAYDSVTVARYPSVQSFSFKVKQLQWPGVIKSNHQKLK